MPAPERPAAAKVAPETIGRVAEEVVRVPLTDKDRTAVANQVQALLGDMAAMLTLDVGENEPALVYDPAEAES